MNRVKISINNEHDAMELVNSLAPMSGNFSLVTENYKECVNAKSYLGVLYFMVIHPGDTYLFSEDGMIPDEYMEDDADV